MGVRYQKVPHVRGFIEAPPGTASTGRRLSLRAGHRSSSGQPAPWKCLLPSPLRHLFIGKGVRSSRLPLGMAGPVRQPGGIMRGIEPSFGPHDLTCLPLQVLPLRFHHGLAGTPAEEWLLQGEVRHALELR
jgi:hypothetical protein